MSTTITAKSTSHSRHKHHHKRRVRKNVHKKVAAGRRALSTIDASVHLFVALMLIVIAVVMLVETMRTLLMSSSPFAIAAGSAIEGIIFVLIIVEITRTVFVDSNGVALRKLLVITIVSVLRGVLLLGALPSIAGAGADSSGQTFNRPLELALSTAVVLGLAVAFKLVRRAGAGQ